MRKRKYQFRMFGGLYLTTDGKTIPISSLVGKQLIALLTYLICNINNQYQRKKSLIFSGLIVKILQML